MPPDAYENAIERGGPARENADQHRFPCDGDRPSPPRGDFAGFAARPPRREAWRSRGKFDLRLYKAPQFRRLFPSVPSFELCDVYDFWYEIDEPLKLNGEISDTVFILKKTMFPLPETLHHRISSVLGTESTERLHGHGAGKPLLDADCTLKRYRGQECALGVADWLCGLAASRFRTLPGFQWAGRADRAVRKPLGIAFCGQGPQTTSFRLPPGHATNEFSPLVNCHRGGPTLRRHLGGPSCRANDLSCRADPSRGRTMVYSPQSGPERWLLRRYYPGKQS